MRSFEFVWIYPNGRRVQQVKHLVLCKHEMKDSTFFLPNSSYFEAMINGSYRIEHYGKHPFMVREVGDKKFNSKIVHLIRYYIARPFYLLRIKIQTT